MAHQVVVLRDRSLICEGSENDAFHFPWSKKPRMDFLRLYQSGKQKNPGHSAGFKEGRKGLPLPCDRGEKGAFVFGYSNPHANSLWILASCCNSTEFQASGDPGRMSNNILTVTKLRIQGWNCYLYAQFVHRYCDGGDVLPLRTYKAGPALRGDQNG